MTKTYTVDIQKDKQTEDLFVELPPELLENLGWKTGDDVKWEETKEGGFILKKVKYETIELDFDDGELFKYMQMAHDRNQSFNEFVADALTERIEREEENG
tara:strand:- start:1921 stop:2223 length:303 start_codon:yes stop_codon:yes gene_type:complete